MAEPQSNHPPDTAQAPEVAPPATPLREQHGAVTKRIILEAARTRFAQNGYTKTSVKEIAQQAGVAVQTLYTAFGSKAAVVAGLADLIDEEAGVHPLFAEMFAVSDPTEALDVFARIRRRIRERCGDMIAVLRAGSQVDAAVAAAWSEGLRRRHAGIGVVVERIDRDGKLRAGLDPTHAADIVAAAVTDEVCDVLVDQRGWTFDAYEQWLASTLRLLILEPPPARTRARRPATRSM